MSQTPEQIAERLLPRPRNVKVLPAEFALDNDCRIQCGSPEDAVAGERLAALIKDEWGLALQVQSEITEGACFLRIAKDEKPPPEVGSSGELEDEEYTLRVEADGAVVTAGTTRALLWGAMTLRQLVSSRDQTIAIPGVEIRDRPRYALRGFMIDSGRAPNSLPKIKRIIRICSAFKLNALFFREGDDEMNAVKYRSNKLGSLNPHAFTLEELSELDSYAHAHGITLIPEVESLGHSTAKGIHYPELISGGFEHKYEGIGTHIRKSHLSPCDPESLKLLESIYDDLFAALQHSLIHLGLDEVRLEADIQARHMAQVLPLVFKCAARHDKQASPMVWSDAPETPKDHKGEVLRCLWEYGDGNAIGIENEHLTRQGITALSNPGCAERVLMAGGSGSGHTPYSKSPYDAAFRNLAEWAMWGDSLENHVGLFAVQWSGNMTDDWLPDFLAAADYGWTPPKSIPAYEAVDERIRGHLTRIRDASEPQPNEVDRPSWDAIWLKGNEWEEEVLEVDGTSPARQP